jgi:hypothetical protein
MATVMNRHGSHHEISHRSTTQKICIGIGLAFILIGMAGTVIPGIMGLHMSLAHNMIHFASGILALWAGYADDPRKAYNFSLAFGAVYGLLGVTGFAFGEPGYPGVGHMEADENLLRIIPNALEFGTNDHLLHILIGVVLMSSAYAWKKRSDYAAKAIVNTQARTVGGGRKLNKVFRSEVSSDLPNSESDLKDAELGHSDVYRKTDYNRRSDFERRI